MCPGTSDTCRISRRRRSHWEFKQRHRRRHRIRPPISGPSLKVLIAIFTLRRDEPRAARRPGLLALPASAPAPFIAGLRIAVAAGIAPRFLVAHENLILLRHHLDDLALSM